MTRLEKQLVTAAAILFVVATVGLFWTLTLLGESIEKGHVHCHPEIRLEGGK